MPKALLYLLVLTAGMTTMATEMSASRLLAPYFGNSLFVWANLIGLILIYLTAGYWLGGRLADRRPEPRLLGKLTLASAAMIAALPFIARPVMNIAIKGMEEISAGAFLGSFAVTVLLFAAPVTILGMVPPFAIRLGATRIESVGNLAGGIYALSTAGSIVGTFLPVLLLIPAVGTRNTMLLFAGALAIMSAAVLGRGTAGGVPLLIIGALALPQGTIKPSADSIFETESPYHYIQVVERGGTRYLQLNEGWAVHSAYTPGETMSGSYWDFFLIAPWFASDRPPRAVLNIGSAAGTIGRQFTLTYPGVHIDGVEIDPEIAAAGQRFFSMDEANMTVHIGDGRPFLRSGDSRYDVVALDAYRQPYIPFYLTTREFFEEVRGRLAANGVVMINVGKTPENSAVVDAIAATMRSVFPTVYSFPAGSFNQILVATAEPTSSAGLAGRTAAMPPEIAELAGEALAGLTVIEPGGTILTDDRAPVEWLTDQMIISYAASH